MIKISPYVFAGLKANTFQAITAENILIRAASFYKVRPDKILSSTRLRQVAVCRHAISFTMCKLLDRGLEETSGFLGGRHHSTSVHSNKKFLQLLETDEIIREQYEKFLLHLNDNLALEFKKRYRFEKKEVVRLKEGPVYNLKPLPENFGEKVFLGEIINKS